jgi:hypothetical protein
MHRRLSAALGSALILVPALIWSRGDRTTERPTQARLPKALGAIPPRLSPDGSTLAFSYLLTKWFCRPAILRDPPPSVQGAMSEGSRGRIRPPAGPNPHRIVGLRGILPRTDHTNRVRKGMVLDDPLLSRANASALPLTAKHARIPGQKAQRLLLPAR